MDGDVVSVERVMAAPAPAIFALLADASRHAEFDGSGTVRGARSGTPERLVLGSTFGMSMRMVVPYAMVSTVIELVEDERIAWQTRPPGIAGRFAGGRIWRYELTPTEGGTTVRESWDISHEVHATMVRPLRGTTVKAMAATLERIEQVLSR